MIISASAAITYKQCRAKAFNIYHRGITSTTYPLIDGGAMHAGIAHGMATKDWDGAYEVAMKEFEKRTAEAGWSIEYDLLADTHKQLVNEMVRCYAEAFKGQDIQVVMPEVTFKVPLANSYHNNLFQHWMEMDEDGTWREHWNENSSDATAEDVINHKQRGMGGPSWEAIKAKRVASPHSTPAEDCNCWQPHYLVGTTDAIVLWNRTLWLMEHKSTAVSGEQFWAQFRLDLQPTAYLLAITKQLNMRIAGFILNAIRKPTDAQVNAWNAKRKDPKAHKQVKDYIEYQREAYLRTPEQLEDLELDLVEMCNEWERSLTTGYFPMSNTRTTCTSYNKLCHFHPLCCSGDRDKTLLYSLLEQSVKSVKPEFVEEI